jgi:hypothetical protein
VKTSHVREARIKKAVEDKLIEILRPAKKNWKGEFEKQGKVDKDELLAVSIGVKYLAVAAKLGEAEWGDEIGDLTKAEDGLDSNNLDEGGDDESENDL